MANHLVFTDDNSELKCYLNKDLQLYVEISNYHTPEYPNYITLDKDDIEALIGVLSSVLDELDEIEKGG